MKKHFRTMLFLALSAICVMCAGLIVGCGSSDDAGTAGLDYYLLDDGTYGVRIGTMTEVSSITIGSKFSGKKVTTILESGFAGGKFTEIKIPSSIISIGENAFMGCENLESVTIPDSVISIGEAAFSGCKNLSSITIGSGVTEIVKSTFQDCNKLKTVTIPDGVTSIGERAFSDCKSLNSVTIVSGVTSIGQAAFKNCTSLKTVYWNAIECTQVGTYSNYGSDYIFADCSSISNIVIGDGVKTIPSYAFAASSPVTSITIPDSVTSIQSYAFSGCSKLETVYYTGSESDWEEIQIESGNNYLFNATFHFNANEPSEPSEPVGYELVFSMVNVTDYGYAYRLTLVRTDADSVSVIIPDTYQNYPVKFIGTNACSGNDSIVSVTIPKSVTSIGAGAFTECPNLKNFYYEGTMAEWEAVTKGMGWKLNSGINVIHCTDGDVSA